MERDCSLVELRDILVVREKCFCDPLPGLVCSQVPLSCVLLLVLFTRLVRLVLFLFFIGRLALTRFLSPVRLVPLLFLLLPVLLLLMFLLLRIHESNTSIELETGGASRLRLSRVLTVVNAIGMGTAIGMLVLKNDPKINDRRL